MRKFIRNHKKLTALLIMSSALLGFAGWDVAAGIRGRLAAQFDLIRGRYEILAIGLPVPWRPEYARLLRARYGIVERVVAGCLVSEPLIAYVESYNRTSMAAADRRFGHDVFQESAADANRNWQRQHPGNRPNDR